MGLIVSPCGRRRNREIVTWYHHALRVEGTPLNHTFGVWNKWRFRPHSCDPGSHFSLRCIQSPSRLVLIRNYFPSYHTSFLSRASTLRGSPSLMKWVYKFPWPLSSFLWERGPLFDIMCSAPLWAWEWAKKLILILIIISHGRTCQHPIFLVFAFQFIAPPANRVKAFYDIDLKYVAEGPFFTLYSNLGKVER